MWSSSAVLSVGCVSCSVFTCTPRALAVARPKPGQKGSCFLLLQLGVNSPRIRVESF